jgi:outer membrane protein
MKKTILTLALLILISSVSFAQKASTQQSQGVKIAVVDIETIVKELPEAAEADKKLKEMGMKWQDTIITWRKELEEKFQKYQKQKGMMPADAQQKEEESLQALNMKIMQYQEDKFGNQGELAQMRDMFLEPIRNKVRTAIETVAKEEGFNFVLDKGSSAVLFAESKFDITYRVLDNIKRNK